VARRTEGNTATGTRGTAPAGATAAAHGSDVAAARARRRGRSQAGDLDTQAAASTAAAAGATPGEAGSAHAHSRRDPVLLTQQHEMDFGVFATPSCNHARRLKAPPRLDADGLFDANGVAVICGRRQCHFEPATELFGTVQFKDAKVTLTTIAPGRWDPVAVLAACTRAHGNRVYEVDYATAKPTNPFGIDELRIARVVGADGTRPYLSRRPRRHYRDAEDATRNAFAGQATWAFMNVICTEQKNASRYHVRRALRALEDVGLMHIELGPRGGMATAKCTWLPRAYLAPTRLAPADDEALGELA
jgi:hypothetical protein